MTELALLAAVGVKRIGAQPDMALYTVTNTLKRNYYGGGGLLVKAVADERQMRAPAPSPASDDGREWIRCLKCDQRFRVVPVSG